MHLFDKKTTNFSCESGNTDYIVENVISIC
jgi:hypothetical protein